MASWLPFSLPSSIQKRFLSYALSQIGVFDETSLDLDKLNLTWGRQNVIELNGVALDTAAISSKASLPANLQILSGKVGLLKLMVPADIHRSGIVIDAIDVSVSVRYEQEEVTVGEAQPSPEQSASGRGARRTLSPLATRRGRAHRSEGAEDGIPTVQDLARSFLMEEPLAERQQLEASIAAHTASLDDSMTSESSQGTEPGTGAALGVPAFLATFLTGILDRIVVNIKNVKVTIETSFGNSSTAPLAVDLLLSIPEAQVFSTPRRVGADMPPLSPIRQLKIASVSVGMLQDPEALDLVSSTVRHSPSASVLTEQVLASTQLQRPTIALSSSLLQSRASLATHSELSPTSDQTADTDRFADAHDDHYAQSIADSQYGIHAGDDNISWGSRQTDGGHVVQNLWQSVADEDDLPDSLLLGDDEAPVTPQRHQIAPASRLAQSALEPWPVFEANTMGASQYSASEAGHSMVSADEHVQSPEPVQQPEHAGPVSDSVPQDDYDNSLAESRIFSHDEAESMYMSAMPQDHPEQSQQDIAVPGAWGEDSQSTAPWHVPAVATEPEAKSEAATPRAQTPVNQQEALPPPRNIKILLHAVDVDLAFVLGDLKDSSKRPSETPPIARSTAFSTASLARSLPKQESSLSALSASTDTSDASTTQSNQVHALTVAAGALRVQVDLDTVHILARLASILQSADEPRSRPSAVADSSSSLELNLTVKIKHADFVLQDNITVGSAALGTATDLVRLNLLNTAVYKQPQSVTIHLGNVALWILEAQIVSFVREQADGSKAKRRDLEILYSSGKTDVKQRTVPELSMHGQALQVNLDLVALAQLLDYAGGLSVLLERSNALFGTRTPPTPASKRPAAVRFQDEPAGESSGSLKANVRLAGTVLALQGQCCGIVLRTSSLKAIQRDYGFSLSTLRLEIEDDLSSSTGNQLTVDNLRLDFYNTPVDKDLERLLTLLTPSNDKYDNDDDILLETLLRQRRKGACLRVTIDAVTATAQDIQALTRLESLSTDLSQLSVVTKYLPEDDRPGLLSVVRLKDFSASLPTTPSLGRIHIAAKDLQCAHVGLPLLVAAAISDLQVERDDGTVLVHQLLPYSGFDNLPMVMARMLGDEVEPLVKVKLYNICIEYSVPVLLNIIGEETPLDTELIVNDLTRSVVDIATSTLLRDVPSSPSTKPDKKTKLDLLIHSCAIGLTPTERPSKALFVLSDARLSLSVPPSETIAVLFEMRRAAMFITNDTSKDIQDAQLRARGSTNTATDVRVSTALSRLGYASIMSIMSASIRVSVHQATAQREATTEVDIGTQLMLMETCADSTQTLFATLGALAPPGKPSTQPQYLQEPVTLEDMISSFTGAAVTAPQPSQDTLFDVEDDLASELNLAMQTSQQDITSADDILMQSELTESLYGPVSGLMDGLDDELDEDDRPPAEAAESLLEEDPFVMTVTPDDLPFSDPTLMKDLRDQRRHPVAQPPTQIELIQVEDLGYDALGPEVQVLGDRRRFAAPTPAPLPSVDPSQHCPIKVRLRDVHFIWNLHDGYDWQKTRDGITSAVEKVEQRAEERLANRRHSRHASDDEESVIGDFLFNSIYIGVPSTQEAQDIRRQINRHIDDLVSETESVPMSGTSRPTAYSVSGMPTARPRRRLKLERSRSHKIAFELKGLSADFLLCAPDSPEVQSSVDVRVKGFEIFDNVPTSTWKKFLTLLHSEDGREVAKPMVHLKLLNVRTIQDYAATEMIVKASLLPLRLHVDQDALDFITRFFEFKEESKTASEPSDQPFLQRVEVDTVDLQLDYKPKKVDYAGIRSGHTTEFMNFIVLDAANIRLKHAIVYGIKGFEPLHKTLNDVWMPDVRRNQLPTVLAGLAPVRSLVNITSGVRDVVAIPIREYQKDGRLVRSIQKGAYHFGKTTASELARLGAKVALGTQNILSGAEGLLAPAPTAGRPSPSHRVSSDYGWHEVEEDGDREKRAISAYSDQPLGVLSGLRSARRYLEHDLLTAKDALIAVQGEVMNSSSPGAAAVAVARHAPTVILRPVIGATRAVGTTLLGVGNQIDRDNLRRMEDVSPCLPLRDLTDYLQKYKRR